MTRMMSIPGVIVRAIQRADDGPPSTAQVLRCSTCRTELPVFSAKNSLLPPGGVAKAAQRAGWTFHTRGSTAAHECPKCKAKKETPRMADAAPRDPKPADKRAIFAKLTETYDTRNLRYCDAYTDQVVAKELGVPRAWVEMMRDDAFGPAGKNVEMDRVTAELGAIRAEVEKATAEALTVAEKFETLTAKIDAQRKRIDAIAESVGPRPAKAG